MKNKLSKMWYRLFVTAANLLVVVYTILIVLRNEQDFDRLLGILALISGLILITVVDTVNFLKADR